MDPVAQECAWQECAWYARMLGWSAFGSAIALEFGVLPLSGGARAVGAVLWAAIGCCLAGVLAMIVSEWIEMRGRRN